MSAPPAAPEPTPQEQARARQFVVEYRVRDIFGAKAAPELELSEMLARARHAGEVAERERTRALVEAARAWTTGCDGKGMCRAQSCCDTCSQPERVMALKTAIRSLAPAEKETPK